MNDLGRVGVWARQQLDHLPTVQLRDPAQELELIGPDLLVAPEQAAVLDPDRRRARETARGFVAKYLAMPNYVQNLRRLGFTDRDLAGDGDAWSIASSRMAMWARSSPVSASICRPPPMLRALAPALAELGSTARAPRAGAIAPARGSHSGDNG